MADQPQIRTETNRHTLGVIGVRDFRGNLYDNASYIVRTLEVHLERCGLTTHDVQVVTGGGKGVEDIVCQWCAHRKIAVRKIPPNINDHGPQKAFTMRNNHVVSQSDELVMFWDGSIALLGDSIMTAMHLSKQATIYPVV